MALQFFLKHKLVKDIMSKYGYADLDPSQDPKSNEHKGLVITVDFEQESGSPNYIAKAKVQAVMGPISSAGTVPPIAGADSGTCPHPPPCK